MKRRRKIRIRPLGILFLAAVCAVLIGVIVLCARACHAGVPASAQVQPEPTSIVTPEPATIATPEPDASQVQPPVATAAPSIQADWYIARNARLRRDLKLYGGYADDAAVEAAILSMNIDPDGKMIALTFDDGPNATYTGQVLDVLQRYQARATFFIVGEHIPGNEALLERMLSLGCEIGNHTEAHTNLRDVSIEEARECIQKVNDTIKTLFDYDVRLLRPPYGSYKTDDDRIKLLAKDMGMSIIMWRRSVHDSHVPTPTADYLFARATMEIDDEDGTPLNNAILLFHDKYPETVEALERIVPALQAQGYQLVTVSELLQTDPGGMNPGGVYRYKG